ncbi:MAG: hypothetical protein ACXVCP_07455 [Bdellovibrio sp.]
MNENELEDFKKIIEAPLMDLFNWRGPALHNEISVAYMQTLIGYFSRDITRFHGSARTLKRLLKMGGPQLSDICIALRLNRIRRCILRKQLHRARILCQSVDLNPITNTVWEAEFLFLFARVHEFEERNTDAYDLYKKAGAVYEANNCKKKSMRSVLNSLVCYGREAGEDELLPKYVYLYNQCRLSGDSVLASTCCHNISVILLTIGARQSSLLWANKALEEVNSDAGSLNYFQCLLHRADTLLKMNRPLEGRRDIEEALISEHATIQGAASKLLKKLGEEKEENLNNEIVISPGWKRREDSSFNDQSLSELEDKLIGLLIDGTKSRDELIENLWTECATEQEFLVDRFKQVLKRLRKKIKFPIRQMNSLYFIDFAGPLEFKKSCG